MSGPGLVAIYIYIYIYIYIGPVLVVDLNFGTEHGKTDSSYSEAIDGSAL